MKNKNMFADMLFTGIYISADLFSFWSVYGGVSVDSAGPWLSNWTNHKSEAAIMSEHVQYQE